MHMEFQTRKLYRIEKYYWFLYPSKEKLSKFWATCTADLWRVKYLSIYYTEKIAGNENDKVSYLPASTIFYCVEQDREMIHVLSPQGNGWLNVPSLKTYEQFFTMITDS